MYDLYDTDYGVTIRLDCKVDVSSASTIEIMIKKPSAEVVMVDALIDPTDNNKIYYVIPSTGSPIDEGAGTYVFRSQVTFSASRKQQGDPASLVIGDSWEESGS